MLTEIASRFGVSLDQAVMIGDDPGDIEAARQSGATPVLVRTGHGAQTLDGPVSSTETLFVADDLAHAVETPVAIMILIRSLIYFVLMALTVLTHGLTIVLLHRFVPVETSDRIATHWGKVNIWLQWVVCGLRINMLGAENLPTHSAHYHGQAPIHLGDYLAAWSAGSTPVMGIEKGTPEYPRIRPGPDRLSCHCDRPQGRPQGNGHRNQGRKEGPARRSPGGGVSRGNPGLLPDSGKKYGIGGAILAEKTGYPIVPIAHNAGVYWKRRGVKKYPGTIEVRVGKPMETKGKGAAEIIAEVEQWIEGELEKLPNQLP